MSSSGIKRRLIQTWELVFTHGPKSDRIAQRVHAQDTMFPLRPRGSGQVISRTWLRDNVDPIPFRIDLLPEPQHTRSEERYSDDLSEHCLGTMPTNARTWSILGYKHVLESIRFHPGKR